MPIHLAYCQTVLVLLMATLMRIQITLNAKPAYHNATIVQIITPVLPVSAILHGIIVVWDHNATAHQDLSAIFHCKLIVSVLMINDNFYLI
jgi:hypothetical protein